MLLSAAQSAAAASGREAQDFIPQMGPLVMIRISYLAIVLVLSLMIPASAQENKPSQAPSQTTQPKEACRAKCEAQYNENKECQEGVAPMHSPCELFNQCLSDCD